MEPMADENNTPNTKSQSDPEGEGCGCLMIIAVIVFIVFLLNYSSCSSSGSSHSYTTEETLEFADNIDTPGTSEYKWYHEEYLPDNGYPDD